MACAMSDTELRDRLRELGVSAGPITDSTRSLYQHKLWNLTQNGGSKSQDRPKLKSAKSLPLASSDSSRTRTQHPVAADRAKSTRPPSPPTCDTSAAADSDSDHEPDDHTSSPAPSGPVTNAAPTLSPQMVAANAALSVVEQMLISFNKPSHLANDTAFIFPSGQQLFASRAILAIQCPRVTQFLYSKEDRFPVTVVTAMTGQSATYHVHPSEYVVDLKEKISLAQGYPISELNLIFQDKALINSMTLSSCGVSRVASELTLMLLGASNTTTIHTTTTFFTSAINPSLSISHLNLGLRLDSLLMGGAPVAPPTLAHRQPLPSHLAHIVHVHDVPFDGFQMLLVYLYCKNLMEPPNLNKIGAYVVCYILGEFFHLPSLSQLCLAHVQSLLTVDSALSLVPFAEAINCPPLREISVAYLKIHHAP